MEYGQATYPFLVAADSSITEYGQGQYPYLVLPETPVTEYGQALFGILIADPLPPAPAPVTMADMPLDYVPGPMFEPVSPDLDELVSSIRGVIREVNRVGQSAARQRAASDG